MGKRIPNTIKIRVLDDWLFGLPRHMITTCRGISAGSISRVVDSAESTIPDLALLRAVAVIIRQEGMSLKKVASGIRIRNFIEQMALSEAQVERVLEEIDVHSFKTDQTFSDIANKIHSVHRFASGLGISIHEVPEYIEQKKRELYSLNKELNNLKMQIMEKKIELRGFR